ncbi:MAG TPA: hypothetical protein VGR05_01380, partial [Sphingomicrobium sp.]|nr:hypothetical protein [Sphingomicrobium sp.]
FRSDPSQIVRPRSCANAEIITLEQSLATIPPGAFDYLWLIDSAARNPPLPPGATLVWSGPGSRLYRLGGAPKDVGLGPQQATYHR